MRPSRSKVRARRLAGSHGGRVTYAQLREVGLTPDATKGWIRGGELIRTRPRVYAVGYVRTDLVARIWEAVLYAGPGAYLTGSSAAHQCGLIDYPPRAMIVATPRKCRSGPGIIVHEHRSELRRFHEGVPVAPAAELMLSLAAEGNFNLVRKALANLEYRRELDIRALLAVCRRGRRGSALLRRALAARLPQLAHANSPLEVDFLLLLEDRHLTLPRLNVRLHTVLVDAYWQDLGLVIELDGAANHGTAAQKRRDAGNTATLHAHGITVHRLNWFEVNREPDATVAMLRELGVGPQSAG